MSPDLLLALLAVAFILKVNLESGLPQLESVLPPAFTIGLGLHLEHIAASLIARGRRLTERLEEAYKAWELATKTPELHPDYEIEEIKAIWDQLARKNKTLVDSMSGNDKLRWVRKEQERDLVFKEEVQKEKVVAVKQKAEEVKAETKKKSKNLKQDFYDLVQGSDSGKVELGTLSANLENLSWHDAEKDKDYGPYKSKGAMLGSIKLSMPKK